MKRVFKIVMAGAMLLLAMNAAHAQQKIGYINLSELVRSMPETAKADSQLQEYYESQQQPLQSLEQEFQKTLEEYQGLGENVSELVRADKEKELQDLQERYQQFQNRLQQDAQKKQQALMAPIHDKAMKAVNEVAEENGYTYVIDNSANLLLAMPEGQNMMTEAKQKLGL